jgi:hypothetical protein
MRSTAFLASVFAALGCAASVLSAPPALTKAGSPQADEFFETKVRPILANNCFTCHGPKRQQAGLRLDSFASLLKGSDSGPVVVAGDPDKSPLVRAVRYTGEVKMPPKAKLPEESVEALTAWVKMGVPWPEVARTNPTMAGPPSAAEARRTHWAFQSVRRPTVPEVRDRSWGKTPLDFFVLAKLEEKGMIPSAAANKRTLIRRATFDLIGLPPSAEEVATFEADPSPEAFARVVDRLLASQHYGERWGRHWLDVARYADTKGYFFLQERRYPYAYTYRDYVIRALNDDLPYDQFLVQQLAADRLPLGDDKRPLAAMGFLTLGRRFLNNTHDIIDDRIDVVTRGLMGLTVTCARCHDHKFDPIPTKDYYSLYGVFASSVEPAELPLIADPVPSDSYRAFEQELKALQKEVAEYQEGHGAELKSGNRAARDELRKRQNKVERLQVTHPGSPARAMVLVDTPRAVQPHVFLRGNPNSPGAEVPRQFPLVLAGDDRRPFHEGSGRLELARAITDKENPLTARVMVNRIWLHHFGAGLVRTPSEFGLRGELPTHPELLDYLAWTFVEGGWSVKKLHRLIMLSSVYQQSSTDNPTCRQADPENRLLWRMNRQRLEFEALRDSLLAVSGQLDTRRGGAPVDLTTAPFSTRRTVYGFVDRQNLPGLFRTFDFANPDTSTPQRYTTTVPQQALFLMNSPFVVEQARRLAGRPDITAQRHDQERIQGLYQLVYGRTADAGEMDLGLRFLTAAHAEDTEGPDPHAAQLLSPWEKYAQVLLLANEFAFVD